MRLVFLLGLGLLCLLTQQLQAQPPWLQKLKAPLEKMFGDSTSAPGEPKLVGYPTLAYSPETRWEFGASILYVYNAHQKPENRLSEFSTFTFATLENQYGFWVDHALYSDKNRWFFLGKLRAQSFPLRYYGIGVNTPSTYQARVHANQVWLRERILRRATGNWYAGVNVDIQYLWEVEFEWQPQISVQSVPAGGKGSFNLGLGPSLVYDSRENVLNVRDGLYAELSWLGYRQEFGSNFEFGQTFVDLRYFKSINKRQVLALQAQGTFSSGEIPFNQLPLMGGESLMRGYYLGRYRDRQLLAMQAEYRWLPFSFARRWGAALFFGVGTVAPTVSELTTSSWQLSGGGGIRFLIFPDKDIYTRFDVGITPEGPGYYLFIGEAF